MVLEFRVYRVYFQVCCFEQQGQAFVSPQPASVLQFQKGHQHLWAHRLTASGSEAILDLALVPS